MFPCDHSENSYFFQIIDDFLPNFDFMSTFKNISFILDYKYTHRGTVILLIFYNLQIYWKMFPCDQKFTILAFSKGCF